MDNGWRCLPGVQWDDTRGCMIETDLDVAVFNAYATTKVRNYWFFFFLRNNLDDSFRIYFRVEKLLCLSAIRGGCISTSSLKFMMPQYLHPLPNILPLRIL